MKISRTNICRTAIFERERETFDFVINLQLITLRCVNCFSWADLIVARVSRFLVMAQTMLTGILFTTFN